MQKQQNLTHDDTYLAKLYGELPGALANCYAVGTNKMYKAHFKSGRMVFAISNKSIPFSRRVCGFVHIIKFTTRKVLDFFMQFMLSKRVMKNNGSILNHHR